MLGMELLEDMHDDLHTIDHLIEVEDVHLDGALQLTAERRALADIKHRMVLLRAAVGRRSSRSQA